MVGRFGVGFAAVRSVSDDVVVRSRTGGVRFSLAGTHAELGLGTDAAEVDPVQGPDAWDRLTAAAAARGDALPVLRLPFPAPGTAPDEPDTVVELVLRDAGAVAAVSAQLAALDDALLLALPALDEVVIQDDFAGQSGYDPGGSAPSGSRVLRDVASRWRVHRASGVLDADDSLPTETRRSDWSVLWALPAAGGRAGAGEVLHAPTPTGVGLSFPALLIASFPVDPGRRGVLPGPTTERVAAEAGRAYAAFLGELGELGELGGLGGPGDDRDGERDLLGLVPTGLPASDVDAAIRASADAALGDTPLLRPSTQGRPAGSGADDALDPVRRVAPRDAAFLAGPLGEDPALARILAAGTSSALVTVPVRRQAVARSLGAVSVDLADLVEALPSAPAVVRAALEALAAHAGQPTVLEAVAAMPLPLVDGRVARGARGAVLLDAPHLAGITRALGVRVVHPDAAHPVLERAGAVLTTPRGLLADSVVRSTALAAAEDVLAGDVLDDGVDDGVLGGGVLDGEELREPTPAATVTAVLELVRLAVAESGPDDLPFWLGELPVAADGDVVPLRESALPGTWAARYLDLAQVREDVVARWGRDVLAAAGARADLGVYRVSDVVAVDGGGVEGVDVDYGPDDPAGWLSDWDDYLAHLADELGPGAWVGDVEAVSDLDALREIADGAPAERAEPSEPLAAALTGLSADPDLRRALLSPVRSPDAPGREAVSYTAWFLRRRLEAPFALDDTPLLPPSPPGTDGLDAAVLSALGGLHNLGELREHDWPAVLERLPARGSAVPVGVARAVWTGLAALARDDADRAGDAQGRRVIAPARLPALGPSGVSVERTDDLAVAASARWAQLGPVVPASADVAEALADLLDLPYESGTDVVPDEPGEPALLDPRVRALAPGAPETWRRHAALTVEGVPVAWWVSEPPDREGGPGTAHAVSPEGLARALAELTGTDALLLEAALRDPARADRLSAERAWE